MRQPEVKARKPRKKRSPKKVNDDAEEGIPNALIMALQNQDTALNAIDPAGSAAAGAVDSAQLPSQAGPSRLRSSPAEEEMDEVDEPAAPPTKRKVSQEATSASKRARSRSVALSPFLVVAELYAFQCSDPEQYTCH